MAATLSVRPNRLTGGSPYNRPPLRRSGPAYMKSLVNKKFELWSGAIAPSRGGALARRIPTLVPAGSRADDSAPFEMSVENALKLLGVSDGASFDDILRAKNSILATCKDDEEAIAQVFLLICASHYLFAFFGLNFINLFKYICIDI